MSKQVVDKPEKTTRPHSRAGWIIGLLFAANLLNFYDRAIPAVLLDQIEQAFGINDAQAGLLASAFVIVAALTVIPLGYLADRIARKTVVGWGLLIWSVFTAVGGVFSSFWVFFGSRVGVGVGEAAYDPAAGSLMADLYPTEKRARANSWFQLGFPIGTMLAYFTVGAVAVAFGSWRAPFLIAAVPGIIIAILVFRIREPKRGATDAVAIAAAEPLTGAGPTSATTDSAVGAGATARPTVAAKRASIWSVLRIRSMYGLIIAFAGYNFAAYAIGTFLTPVLQRYYGLDLVSAAAVSGVVIGIGGLIGLLLGGWVTDRVAKTSIARRVMVAAVCLLVAAPLAYIGLSASSSVLGQLVLFLALSYLLGMFYLAAAVPVVSDVVGAKQRSSALGVVFAIGYVIGGAGGPVVVGALSDSFAKGATNLSDSAASAYGLQTAMMIAVPIAFIVAAIGMFVTSRTVKSDRERMLAAEAVA
ncbi:spinster family MFS transporter [Subtercola lobariae]|uniref:MFS transporter n=1 Tax=Subtercola lobariae TaxID=1588641 RepID=A0A917B3Q8_9MICO|nr:MFS transporter [Subtercola lobariae]GGF21334.1 MFS transporter [Subtercola lobariae]